MHIPLKIAVYAVIVAGEADALQLSAQVLARSQWCGIEPLPNDAYAVQVKREHHALLDQLRVAMLDAVTTTAPLIAEDICHELAAIIASLGADGYTDITSAPPDQYLGYKAYLTRARAMPLLDLGYTLHDVRCEHPAGDTFVTGLLEALDTDDWQSRLAEARTTATNMNDRAMLAWLQQGGGPDLPQAPTAVGTTVPGSFGEVTIVSVGDGNGHDG